MLHFVQLQIAYLADSTIRKLSRIDAIGDRKEAMARRHRSPGESAGGGGDRGRRSDAVPPTPLTRDEVIVRLQTYTAQHGTPTSRWLKQHDALAYRSLLMHFESIAAARKAALVPSPEHRRRWSRTRVLEELRRLARQPRLSVTTRGLYSAGYSGLVSAARKYVGSLPRARRLAGVPEPSSTGGKRERWDEDRVIHEIHARHRGNLPLAVTKVPRNLVDAACKYCGSWREAIEMAGLSYDAVRLRRASRRRDEVLEALRAASATAHGGTPVQLGKVLSRQARRWFGDVRTAAVAAGIEPERVLHRLRFTRDDIRSGLRRLAAERPAMTISELRRTRLGVAAERRHGSLAAALESVGIAGWPRRLVLALPAREEMLRALHARRRRGAALRYSGVLADEPRLVRAVVKQFGSWRAGLEAAGLEVAGNERWSQVRILDEIRRRHRDGLPLATRQAPRNLVSAAAIHLGSWRAAIERAGLDYSAIRLQRSTWSRAEVIAAIRASARSDRRGIGPGGFLTIQVARAARRLFGSVRAAIAAAGCDPGRVQRRRRRTDQQLAEELRRLARERPDMLLTELHESRVGMAAKARYGTLVAALARLGIRNWPRRLRTPLPSRSELLQALQRRHARNEPMNQNAVVASEPRLVKASYKHFGTWRAAMTAAGLGALVAASGRGRRRDGAGR
jgi:hypothetical protein